MGCLARSGGRGDAVGIAALPKWPIVQPDPDTYSTRCAVTPPDLSLPSGGWPARSGEEGQPNRTSAPVTRRLSHDKLEEPAPVLSIPGRPGKRRVVARTGREASGHPPVR
jgi:hypothetical protein